MDRLVNLAVYILGVALVGPTLAVIALDLNYDETRYCVPCGWLETFTGCQFGDKKAVFFNDRPVKPEPSCDDIDKATPFNRPLPKRKHQALPANGGPS